MKKGPKHSLCLRVETLPLLLLFIIKEASTNLLIQRLSVRFC